MALQKRVLPDDEDYCPGIYGLWLRVFSDAFFQYNALSRNYLFDPDNQFFDYVAECLDFEPDVLREKIRKVIEKRQNGLRGSRVGNDRIIGKALV